MLLAEAGDVPREFVLVVWLDDTRVLDAIEAALSGCDGNPLLGTVATVDGIEIDKLHTAL